MLSRLTRAAFTIIELLIVVAIIALLATLLIPRYTQYYARARQAEVAVNLSSLYTAEQAHFVEHGQFTDNLSQLNWQPKGYTTDPATRKNYYTYGFFTPNSTEGAQFFTGASQAPANALKKTMVDGDRFIAQAAAQTNGALELWSIDETGNLSKEASP